MRILGTVTLESSSPEETAKRFSQALRDALLRLKPLEMEVRDLELWVRGGFWPPRAVLNWNLLLPITFATIRTILQGRTVEVTYELDMTQYVLISATVSSLFFVLTVLLGGSLYLGGLAVALCIWLAFLANYAITRFRFRRLVRNTLMRAQSGTALAQR